METWCIPWVHKELDMTELLNNKVKTGSKLGNEINKAVYCHPVYLTYIQNASLSTQHFLPIAPPGKPLCAHCCSVTKYCLTRCKPTDCSLPGSSVHGIIQAGILEWVAISFSTRSIYIILNR